MICLQLEQRQGRYLYFAQFAVLCLASFSLLLYSSHPVRYLNFSNSETEERSTFFKQEVSVELQIQVKVRGDGLLDSDDLFYFTCLHAYVRFQKQKIRCLHFIVMFFECSLSQFFHFNSTRHVAPLNFTAWPELFLDTRSYQLSVCCVSTFFKLRRVGKSLLELGQDYVPNVHRNVELVLSSS